MKRIRLECALLDKSCHFELIIISTGAGASTLGPEVIPEHLRLLSVLSVTVHTAAKSTLTLESILRTHSKVLREETESTTSCGLLRDVQGFYMNYTLA